MNQIYTNAKSNQGFRTLLYAAAAEIVAPHCDAVDLNLGCPQHIARKGRYGAFLMREEEDEWKSVTEIIKAGIDRCPNVKFTAKIRVFESNEKTVNYAKQRIHFSNSRTTFFLFFGNVKSWLVGP